MTSERYFVTGTDTGIGKTHVTCLLARQFIREGKSVACFKPLASGAEQLDGQLVNDDVTRLDQAASVKLPLDQLNPYCFAPPIAPHIAARQAGVNIQLDVISQAIEDCHAEVVLIEGFGGWLAPVSLTAEQVIWQADIARAVDATIILIAGMRLGCLNHSLLTARHIQQDKLVLAGWFANHVDPDMLYQQENIDTLIKLLDAPFIGSIDFEATPVIDTSLLGQSRQSLARTAQVCS